MLEQLNTIGVALSAERDHERLLTLILSKSREVTTADAGSLFLVESIDEPIGPEDKKGDQARVQSRWLVFRLAQNDSRAIKFEEEVLQINNDSVAGHVALTGKTLKIDDAYHLPPDLPFTFNRRIDEATGYRSRSMLVVPMQNREGETIGVLQLINKKPDAGTRLSTPQSFEKEVASFSDLDERLVSSLASQAAVSVENNALYQRIEKLLDNFVEASVMAIESRDPVTKGHSRRVAKMTVSLARHTNEIETGPYRDLILSGIEIRELKYAALLHDFGKVGVEEKLLKKSKKLLSGEFGIVRERFATIRRSIEVRHLRAMLNRLSTAADITEDEFLALEESIRRDWTALDQAWETIRTANEPTVTHFDDFEGIEELSSRRYQDPEGLIKPYLKNWEIQALKIAKGTLTERERQEINDHVKNSYDFLRKIPWTRDLQNIPKIARGHHEKLDGTGYPYGLRAEEIPPQTRMMTIADIFDALAAQDRPYKPRVPTETALDILVDEASRGQLDQDLLNVFIEAKIYRDIE
jgi:HD-GYP domain-containing protein (c-di-GMP phosphodiesterase class II)